LNGLCIAGWSQSLSMASTDPVANTLATCVDEYGTGSDSDRTQPALYTNASGCDPERILIAFKANATRKLRAAGCWRSSQPPLGPSVGASDIYGPKVT
jgi:hypothetical protein